MATETETSFKEMTNRATVAKRIAFLIVQNLRHRRLDNPLEAKEYFKEIEASKSLWTDYARAAMNERARKEPSAETKFQVRMLVDFALSSACIDCGRLAEESATPGGSSFADICTFCHQKQFADESGVAHG